MKVTLDLFIFCDKCGCYLDKGDIKSVSRNGIYVKPCRDCFSEQFNDGFNEGITYAPEKGQ